MIKILIVEDNDNLRRMIDIYLKQNNFETYLAKDGLEALDILDCNSVDLIICDIMMPKMNGFELIEELRSVYVDLPIIIVTAKESKEDKIIGFELGTDDYMTKPIDLEELLMRIKALLRRYNIKNDRKLNIGDVVLDYDNISVSKNGKTIYLAKKEFYLLYKLLSYPGRIFTRMELNVLTVHYKKNSTY